ncbi:hypothetical protein APHMUC_0976 [Anaplasma phagocytophilum str. ApMUC09]|uniref:Uncharacterized protein n=1 Tax=Anaplasma phagocytophilum str. ApMUC09 TaxID=1359152 RepID=A0A0F3NAJ6_ANAPH|nr:hypothetical protein APHMUC_0976 [Anaplasma phagocytophilum str. ApMUC09]
MGASVAAWVSRLFGEVCSYQVYYLWKQWDISDVLGFVFEKLQYSGWCY